MSDLIITSPSNPRLKNLIALRRRRSREESGLTLIEGFEELSLALEAGVLPRAVYYCPELMQDPESQLDVVSGIAGHGVDTIQLGRGAFEKVAYREGPDGFLAVVESVTRTCADLEVGPDALALLCQGVEKPGNLGAMLRTADAAGVEAVIAADPVTDWGNPNLVRASKGTVFSVPVASDNTAATIDWLSGQGSRWSRPPPTPTSTTPRSTTRGRGHRRGRREVRAHGRGPRRGGTPRADPHGGPGQLAQRRHLGRHRDLRGGPPAQGALSCPPGRE